MDNGKAAGLYEKFKKSVPKDKRSSLKKSLEEANGEKLDKLANMELGAKSSRNNVDSFICIMATLLAVIFLAVNLIVFMAVNPNYEKKGQIAVKIGEELKDYVRTAETMYSVTDADGEILTDCMYPLAEEYNKTLTAYNGKVKEYNTAYEAYVSDYTYVNDKAENYLKYKTDFAVLNEPAQGGENYGALKEQYDKNKKLCEDKIKEYEEKATRLASELAAVEEMLPGLSALAESYAAAQTSFLQLIIKYQNGLDIEEKVSAYGNFKGYNDKNFYEYLTRIHTEIGNYRNLYGTSYKDVESYNGLSDGLPAVKEADAAAYDGIYSAYQSAKTDLKKFVEDYAVLQLGYEKYKEENKDKTDTDGYKSAVKDYETKLGYRDRVCKAYGLTDYYGFLLDYKRAEADGKLTDSLTEQLKEYEAKLSAYSAVAGWTDGEYVEKFLSHNSLIAEYNGYAENNKSDADYADKSADYQKRISESEARLNAYKIVQNVECDLGGRHVEKSKVVNDAFNASDYGVKAKSAEYASANAYYAVEQLAVKLKYALNSVGASFRAAADYCNGINGKENLEKIEELTFSAKQGQTVLKDINFDGFTAGLNDSLSQLEKFESKTEEFADLDLSKDQTADINSALSGMSFEGHGEKLKAASESIKSEITAADKKYIDYRIIGDTFTMLIMVFDIVYIAVSAAYFAYSVGVYVMRKKMANYMEIKKCLG